MGNKKVMFRLLEAREIECRVAQVNKEGKGLSLLLYKDARCDQSILDETVGAMNWMRHHSRDNANCIVSLWDAEKQQWIEKEDTGTESNTEAEKGLASDSFKRACFCWGIGRELYTAPFIWIESTKCKIEKDQTKGKYFCNDHFEVREIGYNEHREINLLTIVNTSRNAVVFSYKDGAKQKVPTPELTDEEVKETAQQIIPDCDPERKADKAQVEFLRGRYTGANLEKLLKANNIDKLEDITALKAGQIMSKLAQKGASA